MKTAKQILAKHGHVLERKGKWQPHSLVDDLIAELTASDAAYPELPDGCECQPDSWGDTPDPICATWLPARADDERSACQTCSHDKACHKEKP